MPTTPTYGFVFEDDADEPGNSLRAPSPILAEQVETEIARIDAALQVTEQGTYTPTLTAATTNPNLGSTGSIVGSWHRAGNKVDAWIRIHFDGTGVDAGAGIYEISLPFAADTSILNASTIAANGDCVGEAALNDVSAGVTAHGICQLRDPARIGIVTGQTASGGNQVNSTSPWGAAWATGDRIAIHVT